MSFAIFNDRLMQMVRHKHQLEYTYFVLDSGSAEDSEIQQIVAYGIEEEAPVLCALVAMISTAMRLVCSTR